MILKKKPGQGNVYEAALERTRYIYSMFDHVAVSFSGGKDSTAVLHIALQVAKETGRLPLHVFFFDEEAIHPPTIEYVDRIRQRDDISLDWYCLQAKHRNACSQASPWWHCWDDDCPDLWVRPMPEHGISSHPEFRKGMTIPDISPRLFPSSLGQVCVLTGMRSQESIRRYRIVANKRNENFLQAHTENGNVRKGHPIYDWDSNDVWRLVAHKALDYNRTYDILDKTGLYEDYLGQRVCPPFGEEPLRGLWIYAQCWPEMWHKMLARVPGVATAWRYANTALYSVAIDSPPMGLTWKQYAQVLADNFAGKEREHINESVSQSVKLHYSKSTLALNDEGPDPISGCDWKFLCKCIIRGDFKGRSRQSMDQNAAPTRKKMGINLRQAIELYGEPEFKADRLHQIIKIEEEENRIIE